MTREQHLLTIGGEEGAEITQRFSKALRFGPSEIQPGQDFDNRMRILEEVADLLGVLEMLDFAPIVPPGHALRALVDAKKAKVEVFLEYSRELGTLTEQARPEDR